MVHAQEKISAQANIKWLDDDEGLDDLVSGHAAQIHGEKRKIESVGDSKFGELLRKYELCLESIYIYNEEILNKIKEILTPKEINEFLQLTNAFYDYNDYDLKTGIFISDLIQLSYNSGYNNFVINTRNLINDNISLIGSFIKGKPERVCYIQVDGGVGTQLGVSAENLSFVMNGYVGSHIGAHAKNSSFTINEDFNSWVFAYNATFCNFKTQNPKTLDKLLEYVPKDKDNNVYFINPDGSEETVSVLNRFVRRMVYKFKEHE